MKIGDTVTNNDQWSLLTIRQLILSPSESRVKVRANRKSASLANSQIVGFKNLNIEGDGEQLTLFRDVGENNRKWYC